MSSAVERPSLGRADSTTALLEDVDDHDDLSISTPTSDRGRDVVLVDYDMDDPENPMTWSAQRKWLIVFAISWMGFVR
jgi:hypothetical protein